MARVCVLLAVAAHAVGRAVRAVRRLRTYHIDDKNIMNSENKIVSEKCDHELYSQNKGFFLLEIGRLLAIY